MYIFVFKVLYKCIPKKETQRHSFDPPAMQKDASQTENVWKVGIPFNVHPKP